MYRFYFNNVDNDYHYGELARVFLPDEEFETVPVQIEKGTLPLRDRHYIINASGSSDRDEIKRELFELLSGITGRKPEWGTLTGVRPLKLAYEVYDEAGSAELMQELMRERYLLSETKSTLLREILEYQTGVLRSDPSSFCGLYIGIPFCPTRCEYCAFASNVASEEDIALYLDRLIKEIEYTGDLAVRNDSKIESVYIGGGTPTTLDASQLSLLIDRICRSFDIDASSIEFTVEAGRPDTITDAKLEVLRDRGISRISINPQTMKDDTLRLIGRAHTADDIRRGYRMAMKYGFDMISYGTKLIGKTKEEILYNDFKRYPTDTGTIGLGQIYTTNIDDFNKEQKGYITMLNNVASVNEYKFVGNIL